MENFIYDYFIEPIWSRSGYNVVNTLAYAVIAIASLYVINLALKNRIKIDERFVLNSIPFILFGATIRVVTDSIDNGTFTPVTPLHQFVLDSHIWDYGYLTVSPGTYILTAFLFFVSLAVLYKIRRTGLLGHVGLALWLPHLLLLIPFMQYALFAIPILILAAIPTYLALKYFKDRVLTGIVAGQALDGAATFFIIDVFSPMVGKSYFEQHVFSAGIGELFGTYLTFYLVKAAIAFAAAYVIREEKMELEDKYFIALALIVMGLGPGTRDMLRMMAGT